MARPNLTPQQQLPSIENAIAVKESFHRYKDDPFADLGMREAELAEKHIRKDLVGVLDAQVLGSEAPVLDVNKLTRNVISDSKLLKNALVSAGVPEIPEVKLTRKEILPSAETLVSFASEAKDEVVGAIIPRLRKNLQRLTGAKARKAGGGHEAFDNKIAAAARAAWQHLDNAYDLLGICMRNAGVTADPVYEGRPKTPTDLRFKLQNGVKKSSSRRKGAKGTRASKKGGGKGDGKGDTQPTPPQA